MLYFNLSGLLNKQGLTTDTIKHGESADLGYVYRPLTDKEKEMINKNTDFLYRKFLDRVAGFRNMSAEKIHELGEGRLWLGQEAAERGLVDESGGLYDAISHVKDIIRAKKVRISFYPRQPFIFRYIARRNASNNEKAESTFANTFRGSLDSGLSGPLSLFFIYGWLTEPGEPGPGVLNEIAESCLLIHGRPLFFDPFMLHQCTILEEVEN
ncbi:MAG: S49 family peptidase [Bacteroidales bacterium]